MNIIQKLTTNITTRIDRINISIPLGDTYTLLNLLNQIHKPVKESYSGNYLNINYIINDTKIQITKLKYGTKNTHGYERTYLALLDPCLKTQEYIKSILSVASGGKDRGKYTAQIKELEVSYDFFTTTDTDLIKIKQYVDNHFISKHKRADSSFTFYKKDEFGRKSNNPEDTTFYVGRKGNIRKSSKGTRSYIKTEHSKTFYRFEMQFNRLYLKNNNITYRSLPLNPLNLQVFDHIDILGNFSSTGVSNFSRSILRKQGTTSTSPGFHKLHRKKINDTRSSVLGGTRGSKRKISAQIAELQYLKKKHNLSVNFKQYFPLLHYITNLILCHADIGYPEKHCSKRMVLCQGTGTFQ